MINNTGLTTSTQNTGLMDFSQMKDMMVFAETMAKAKVTLPQHFQDKPGDCLAVIMQAAQWQMNPFAVAQKTYLINGTLGYEAQLVSAVINQRAPIENRLEYEFFGDWKKIIGNTKEIPTQKGGTRRVLNSSVKDEQGVGVRVKAVLKGEKSPRILELQLAQVTTRNSTLWTEDPKQQLSYLAAKKWARLYTPDVILGVYTPDELENVSSNEILLNKEIEDAVLQLGFSLEKQNGIAIVVGKNIFNHSSTLKDMGFNLDGSKWFMKYHESETDYQEVNPEPEIDAVEETAPIQTNPQDDMDYKIATLEDLKIKIEEIGGILSDPTENQKGETWVKAEVKLDKEGLVAKTLINLGFKKAKTYFVREVSDLLPRKFTQEELDLAEEADRLF